MQDRTRFETELEDLGLVYKLEKKRHFIPATDLPQFGSPEQTLFMRRVYELHRRSAAKHRVFVDDLPQHNLEEVEQGVKARRDAAIACRGLLLNARIDLAELKQPSALQVDSIGVASGYRSAQRQFKNWSNYFPKYYRQTQAARTRLVGGEHGDNASFYLAQYIGRRLASPGYSRHNTGTAIDFTTREKEINLGPNTSQVKTWRQSWFYQWLKINAKRFGYKENTNIEEPWHWQFM